MKKLITIGSLALILFVAVSFIPSTAPTTENNGIKWMSFQQALEAQKKVKKKIFIDVYTDWCGWCKVLDSKTFTHPVIAQFINKYYYAVKFNAETKDTIVYKNTAYISSNPAAPKSATHNLAIYLLQGKLGYPSMLYLNEEADVLTAVQSYQTPEQLEPILVFFGENKHLNTKWEEFSANYKPASSPKPNPPPFPGSAN